MPQYKYFSRILIVVLHACGTLFSAAVYAETAPAPVAPEATPAPAVASFESNLQSFLAKPQFKDTAFSINIISLKSGRSLYYHNAQQTLIPASTSKLITSLAALETFGPRHRYPTEFYGKRETTPGVLSSLWIKGYGSPALVDEELQWIAQSLKAKGVQSIQGPLYVDDSYFDTEQPIRFIGQSGKGLYEIITGALSTNYNRPENLRSQALQYENPEAVQGDEALLGREVMVGDQILDPALASGRMIKNALERNGISVSGQVFFMNVPAKTELLLSHSSQELGDVLATLNKFSNNFMAEQVLRSVGAARFGKATRDAGLMVVYDVLKKAGIPERSYQLNNGSGLTRDNLMSAAQLTQILQYAAKAPYAEAFIRSLSIAGVDGTLQRRFHGSPLQGKIWAKTGTLYQVSALAGYLLVGKEPLAFAIIANNFKTALSSIESLQQDILEFVAQKVGNTPS